MPPAASYRYPDSTSTYRYALPCALLMLAGTVSILMKAEPSKLARMDDEYPLAKPTES